MLPFNELLEEVLTENAQNGFDREENAINANSLMQKMLYATKK